jgi:hypothetical protein
MFSNTSRSQVVTGLAIAVTAVALLLHARNLPVINPYGAANAAFWPSIILAALALISIVYMFTGNSQNKSEAEVEKPNYGRLFIVCALTLALPFLSLQIGFLLASLLLLPALMFACGERNKWYLLLTPIVSVVGIYFIFIEAMSMALPRGEGVFWNLSVLFY